METKIYSLKHLSKYENNKFIIHAKSSSQIQAFYYKSIIDEVVKCLVVFRQNVRKNLGIAIDMAGHDVETCVLLLSTLNHGCRFVCLDCRKTRDLAIQLNKSAVTYIVTKSASKLSSHFLVKKECFLVFSTKYQLLEMKDHPRFNVPDYQLCYTIRTSGSTGNPKSVHVPYECIYPNIQKLCLLLNISQTDIIFFGSPPTFDPFVVEFFMALETGSALLIPDYKKRLLPDSLLLKSVTILQTTPSRFRLLGSDFIKQILSAESSLRCLLLGGENFPCGREIRSWQPAGFRSKDTRLFNIYGITEISCWSTIYEYNFAAESKMDSTPLGEPLESGTELQIRDVKTGIAIEGAGMGELWIGSSTRRCFVSEDDNSLNLWNSTNVMFRKSGDIVERHEEGNLFYVGRVNNCVKRFGHKLCLDSLTHKINKNLNIETWCLWDEENKKLILFLTKNITSELNQSMLHIFLDEFEIPDEIRYIERLPLNSHGKVDNKKLMQSFKFQQIQNKTPVSIFCQFLETVIGLKERQGQERNIAKNDFNATFLEVGGTSFQALSISTEIGKYLKRPMDRSALLEMLLTMDKSINEIIHFLEHVDLSKSENRIKFHCNSQFLIKNSLLLLWKVDLKKCVDSTPKAYAKDKISVGSHAGIISTLDCLTGKEHSRLKLPDRVECPVEFVSADLALVGCYDGNLYGFDFNTGLVKWKLNVKGMIKAKPLVMNNTIIVASYADEFNVRAYNLETLKCIWTSKLGTKGVFAAPVRVNDNLVLICSLDGTYALTNIVNGHVCWSKKVGSPIFSSPTLLEDPQREFAMAEVSGRFAVCDIETGEEFSCFKANGNVFSSIVHCRKSSQTLQIFFGCHDANVYCLYYEPLHKRLSLAWKCFLNSPVYATPALLGDKMILACSTQGSIVTIDISNGEKDRIFDVKTEIFSSPTVVNEKYIYVGARDNYLYAFQIK